MIFWDKIKDGIKFEDGSELIPWNIQVQKLINFGRPNISKSDGQLRIEWSGKSLLSGITGDWFVTYLSAKKATTFKDISLYYSGDDESLEAYENIKSLLLNQLGAPNLQDEKNNEKLLKWVYSSCYVSLYLFEMHAYRCVLTIGIS